MGYFYCFSLQLSLAELYLQIIINYNHNTSLRKEDHMTINEKGQLLFAC